MCKRKKKKNSTFSKFIRVEILHAAQLIMLKRYSQEIRKSQNQIKFPFWSFIFFFFFCTRERAIYFPDLLLYFFNRFTNKILQIQQLDFGFNLKHKKSKNKFSSLNFYILLFLRTFPIFSCVISRDTSNSRIQIDLLVGIVLEDF